MSSSAILGEIRACENQIAMKTQEIASPQGSIPAWSGGGTSVAAVKREILDELFGGKIITDGEQSTVEPICSLTEEEVTRYYEKYILPEIYPTTCAFVDALEAGAPSI